MFADALQWRINQVKAQISASMNKSSYLAAVHQNRAIIETTEWPFPCNFSRLLANMAPRKRKKQQQQQKRGKSSTPASNDGGCVA